MASPRQSYVGVMVCLAATLVLFQVSQGQLHRVAATRANHVATTRRPGIIPAAQLARNPKQQVARGWRTVHATRNPVQNQLSRDSGVSPARVGHISTQQHLGALGRSFPAEATNLPAQRSEIEEAEEKVSHGPHLYSVQFADDAGAAADGLQAPDGDPKKMDYHNGPVMFQPVNVYVVWLGSNFTVAQKGLVRTFIASLNPMPPGKAPNPPTTQTVTNWWNVNRLYYDDQKRVVSNTILLKGEYNLPMVPELKWSAAKNAYILTGEQSVVDILTRLLDANVFPVDPNGAYTFFSDNRIYQMGVTGNMGAKMCEKYCGWHDSYPYTPKGGADQVDIKYLWVGIASSLCPKSCIPFAISGGQYVAPSVDAGIHGAISIFAHELAETASDPTGDGWWSDETQEENGDKCQWKYGATATFPTPSGETAIYNLVGLNNQKFLVQGNWDMMTGDCSISRVIATPKK